MATPHVSAVAALALSTHPKVLGNPAALFNLLVMGAQPMSGNKTHAVSKTDTDDMDITSAACPNGYCHNSGPVVPDAEVYGKGFINANRTVRLP